jgi:hemolysin III
VSERTRPLPPGVELFSSWSHGLGAMLALGGLVALLGNAGARGRSWASLLPYGGSLVVLYAASALYHAHQGRWKRLFQRLDHVAIYLVIAGSYTPFAVLKLGTPLALGLCGALWGLAALGTVLEFLPGARTARVVLCLTMGWLAMLVIRPMAQALGSAGLSWVVAGGLLYTLGALFYVLDKRWPVAHGIFHVFVLGGSASHFIAVWAYVI